MHDHPPDHAARPASRGAFGYWRTTGRPIVFPAKAVVLATGGIGKAYEVTSNSWEYSGDGQALAYDAGAELIDMEFVQFHPTGHGLAAGRPRPARHRGGPRRGRDPAQQATASGSCGSTCPRTAAHEYAATDEEAARWVDGAVAGPRRPTPAGRRSCRPATTSSRAIYTEVREGRGSPHGGVFLDISYLPADHVRRKLPSMYEQFKELADVDITTGPMEVGPTTHYVMGGIRVDAETGATTVARPVRGGRGRRRDARREPARRQLAVGPARVRRADRAPAAAALRRDPDGEPYLDPVQVQARPRGARGAARADGRARIRTRSSATSRTMMQRLVGIFRIEADLEEAIAELGRAARPLARRPA